MAAEPETSIPAKPAFSHVHVIWCLCLIWLGFGLMMKTIGLFSGNQHLSTYDGAVIAGEILLIAGIIAFPFKVWMRALLIITFMSFCVVHVMVLTGMLEQCSCFGAFSLSSWVMVIVNAALLLAVLIGNGEPTTVYRWLTASFVSVVVAVLLAITVHMTVVFDKQQVFAPGTPVADVVAALGLNNELTAALQKPAEDEHKLFIYDVTCTVCRQKSLEFLEQARYAQWEGGAQWYFVNVSEEQDNHAESIRMVAMYMHKQMHGVLTPVLLTIVRGQVTVLDYFDEAPAASAVVPTTKH